ncbi:hypothetical protein [Paenibacillus sp. RUD330]|uniref:hypothetical protein n=1 Tax=Paenibacillus sp. RUD330 TaxID=2023772 RepID=UPI000B9289A2|nr:hypothetical protein [Paenibacillus sp. RUD330]ASS67995.1 hypothetical protein CIC07_19065 [Paenibacillus sp. RUD330]
MPSHFASLDKARSFLLLNARLIDRLRFRFHWEEGSAEAVLQALKAYQNPDGGFGHALEPDIRCPHSQPVPLEVALDVIAETGLRDKQLEEGMVQWLKASSLPQGGWPIIRGDAAGWPLSPWWEGLDASAPSINPTGTLLGLLYRSGWTELAGQDWFQAAERSAWRMLERDPDREPQGYHEAVHWIAFLNAAPDRERAEPLLRRLDAWLQKPGVIGLDFHAEGYVHKVLDWAPEPNAYARRFIGDVAVEEHLDAMEREQEEDGGWPMSFPALSPAAEMEWRGVVTLQRLLTLRAYGRL